MSTRRSMVTSSGDFGPPEGGALLGIVPAQCVSSSYDGLTTKWCSAGRVHEVASATYDREFPPLLRLRGGGEETGGVGEEDKQDQAGPSSPIVSSRVRPGPRCSKNMEGIGKGRSRREKDWRRGRRIQPSSEEEVELEEVTKEGRVRGEDEEYVPQSPKEIIELSRMARESAGRSLRSAEEALTSSKPKIVAVTTLEGSSRIRMKSPGVKRGREEVEEEMEVEEESEEDEGSLGPSPRDPSTSRSATDPKGPKLKRKKRGRPPKIPEHEGMFTTERQRAKEIEIIEEKEQEIADPEIKAISAKAKAVDRNARKIMDDLRELPYPELTERALRAIEAIKKVASSSKNLKGSFVGMLWRSSEELTALSMVCSSRMRAAGGEDGGDGESGELEKLRIEFSAVRTEQALIVGENRRLRSQVEELRARVVLGETTAPLPPPPPVQTPPAPVRRKIWKGVGKGKKEIASDSNSSDENMEVMMERELSQEAREEGIKARREVKEDIERGTLPLAVRPSLCGKSKVMDWEQQERESLTSPSTSVRQQRAPILEPSKGLTTEDIVRLIQNTVSQLLPQMGEGMQRQEGKERAQHQQGPSGKVKDGPLTPTPNEKSDGGGKGGNMKEKKRKRNKGKGGSTSQQGGMAPKGTSSPPRRPKAGPTYQGTYSPPS